MVYCVFTLCGVYMKPKFKLNQILDCNTNLFYVYKIVKIAENNYYFHPIRRRDGMVVEDMDHNYYSIQRVHENFTLSKESTWNEQLKELLND